MSDKLQGPWKIRYEGERYYVPVDVDSKFAEIKAQRDELLEALERVKATGVFLGAITQEMVDAAIAKAKGA